MEINISDIKLAFNRIIERLEKENIERVEFENDLYNVINAEDWDITKNVMDVVMIGSLYDDVESIKALVNGKDRFCTTVDFDRLANILRAVGAAIDK